MVVKVYSPALLLSVVCCHLNYAQHHQGLISMVISLRVSPARLWPEDVLIPGLVPGYRCNYNHGDHRSGVKTQTGGGGDMSTCPLATSCFLTLGKYKQWAHQQLYLGPVDIY